MAAARVERRLAAILAADVVGYSRLMEADEAGTFARLKALRLELIEPTLQEHGGRFVDLKGDGAIVEFQSVVAAVEAAVAVQRAMLDRDPELPENRRIRYRIGINLGDVIVDGATIYGDGINVAARIESLCEPGGIWLSRSVYNQVKGKLDVVFAATGLHQVKNISEAVETFRVALDGVMPMVPPSKQAERRQRWGIFVAASLFACIFLGGTWHFWPTEPTLAKPSIAVLPFANMSPDPGQEYLSEGVTQDIITQLARFAELEVIAYSSTASYKGESVALGEIGRSLNVRYIMEGGIAKESQRIKINVRISDAVTGRQIWGETYDGDADDIFSIRDDVTSRVVGAITGLQGRLSKTAASKTAHHKIDAYTLVLQGDDLNIEYTKEANIEARQFFLEALRIEPDYALAYADLAWNYAFAWQLGWADDPVAAQESALKYAEHAVALDEFSAEGHWALGYVLLYKRQYERSRREYERALAITPNYADLLADSATPLAFTGQPQQGINVIGTAMRLNPMYPSWYAWVLGLCYYVDSNYQAAANALAPVADPIEARLYLIGAYAALGRVEEARGEASSVAHSTPGFSATAWAATQPFKSEEKLGQLVNALAEAGLPR